MEPTDFPLLLPVNEGGTLSGQIQRIVTDRINDGVLLPGAVLPGSRRLAEHWGCQRGTVEAGLDKVVADGLMESRIGLGYLVIRPATQVVALLRVPDRRGRSKDVAVPFATVAQATGWGARVPASEGKFVGWATLLDVDRANRLVGITDE